MLDGMALTPLLLSILMALPLISLALVSCAALKKKKDKKQPPSAPPPKKPQGTPVPRSAKPKLLERQPPSPQPTPLPPPPPPPMPKEETTAPETTPAPTATSIMPTATATPTQETYVPNDEDFEEPPPTSRPSSSIAASPVVYDWDMCMDYTPDIIQQHEFLFQLLERS